MRRPPSARAGSARPPRDRRDSTAAAAGRAPSPPGGTEPGSEASIAESLRSTLHLDPVVSLTELWCPASGTFRCARFGTLCHRSARPGALGKVLAQNFGTVVLDVMCAVEQRHHTSLACVEQRRPGICVPAQLLPVSSAELVPALHPMPEPLPKVGARCYILQPRIRMQRLLLHAPWPSHAEIMFNLTLPAASNELRKS